VVETGGLENRFALTGNGGSNPSPSATLSKPSDQTSPIFAKEAESAHIWQSLDPLFLRERVIKERSTVR
jgi:hypothetical protein